MDFPGGEPQHIPTLSVIGIEAVTGAILGYQGGGATAGNVNYPAADLAIYVPFALDYPFIVRRLWWFNGSSLTGNVDCGVYAASGEKLLSSGSTAQSGTTSIQTATVSDYKLDPGSYYLALAGSATGTRFTRLAYAQTSLRFVGVLQQSSALPLPATMSPAAIGQGYLPIFGISSRTLI